MKVILNVTSVIFFDKIFSIHCSSFKIKRMGLSFTQKICLAISVLCFGMYACKHGATDDFIIPVNKNPLNVVVNTNLYDSICFEEQIAPLLVSNCARSGCHNDTTKQSGVILTTYESVMATISAQLLLQCIQDSGQMGMPRSGKLNSSQVNLIKTWINQGMKKGIDCEGPCDTTHVTYSGTILPIIQNSCIGCHVNGTTNLANYTSVKLSVTNGKLLGSINQITGCLPMPQGGAKLPPCKLRQFKIWVYAGALNN